MLKLSQIFITFFSLTIALSNANTIRSRMIEGDGFLAYSGSGDLSGELDLASGSGSGSGSGFAIDNTEGSGLQLIDEDEKLLMIPSMSTDDASEEDILGKIRIT